ncbi:MAG: hypothetical protein ACJA08_000343 [Cyclobacteriaceae bacterium]|jgi:hypothetical protein
MKNTVTKYLVSATLILLAGFVATAQDNETKGKIKLQITREINGEKKVFEGEYENEAQMHADLNYQEFIEDETDTDFNFNFSGDQDVMLIIQKLLDQNGFNFSFGDGGNQFQFGFDSADAMGLQDLKKMAEEMKNLHGNMLFEFDDGDMNWIFSDSTSKAFYKQIQTPDGKNDQGRMIVIKKLEIKDVDVDEFGKKGIVKDSEALSLDQFDYYPNPSNGEFNLRFKVPQQGELSVKIYDLNGKEIFSRYFTQFGGFYQEAIDLTSQNEGIYLLEIKLDKRRLTRKIVIE